MTEEHILTPALTGRYVPDWDAERCLIEIIQNGLDAGNCNITFVDGEAFISDTGPGIQLRHFDMGISEKDAGAKGVFGEGLKLAALVALRLGRSMVIYSNKYACVPFMRQDEVTGNEVLSFRIEEALVERSGTLVILDCTRAELARAKKKFEEYNEEIEYVNEERTASLPGGSIYINGYRCYNNDDLILSYHITMDKLSEAKIGRDKQIDSMSIPEISSPICTAIRYLDDKGRTALLSGLITKDDKTYRENNFWVWGLPPSWVGTLMKLVHRPVIVRGTDEAWLVTKNLGMTPVFVPYGWITPLIDAGCPSIKTVSDDLVKAVVNSKVALTREEEELLTWARDLVRAIVPSVDEVKYSVWDDSPDSQDADPTLLAAYSRGEIFLRRSLFTSKYNLLKALVHELGHKISGTGDGTRAFEDKLTDWVTDALLLSSSD